MDLKQLRYFLAIAEEGQITAAAKRLHIAQPPLSYQLKQLEQELGVTLVKRGPRNITLTGAGELLRKKAVQILDFTDSVVSEVSNYGKGIYGTLSIGAISSCGGVIPNKRMLEFTKNYPDIRFEIHEGNTFTVMDMLEKGIIEIGIVRTPFQHKMINFRYTGEEPMAAVMTANNLCGKNDGDIELGELADKPLIIYRRFDTLIGEAFAKQKIEPFICCKNDDARTTIHWARAGFGIGIVPKSALLGADTMDLIEKDINCRELRTKIAVIWMKKRFLSSLGQKFIEYFA